MNEALKIVIADDNIILANFIKDYIEKNSNFIIYKLVNSSEQEIELLNNEKIDIIITDIIRNKSKYDRYGFNTSTGVPGLIDIPTVLPSL